jgi:hypothetical protein
MQPFQYRSILLVLALLSSLVAQAQTPPLDYVMPYTPRQLAVDGEGIELVSAANFAERAELVLPAAAVTKRFRGANVHYAGNLANNQVSNPRPQILTFTQGNGWFQVGLREGLSPAVTRFGTESLLSNLIKVCETEAVTRNLGNASTGAIVYRIAADCDQDTGQIRTLDLGGAPASVPETLPLDRLVIEPFYGANQRLRFLFAYDGEDKVLRRFRADLRASRDFGANIQSVTFHGQAADGTMFLNIDGVLRLVNPDGTLLANRLRRPPADFVIDRVIFDGTDAFFSETYTPSNPFFHPEPSGGVWTRIYKVPVDGSAAPVRLAAVRAPAVLAGVTSGSVVYTTNGFNYALFEPFPVRVASVPRDGGTPLTLQQMPADPGSVPSVQVNAVIGERVFYTTRRNYTGDPGFGEFRAYTKTAEGVAVTAASFARGSAWVGRQSIGTGSVLGGGQGEQRLMLAIRGEQDSITGAQLQSFDPATLERKNLTKLPQSDTVFMVAGFGAGTIGTVVRKLPPLPPSSADRYPGDVFAFDLVGHRFSRLTEAQASDNPIRFAVPLF